MRERKRERERERERKREKEREREKERKRERERERERVHYIGKLYNKSSEVLNSATDPRLHGVTNLQSC